MRLMKRLAICILAAAMAMSMLTACGDDGPSAPADSTPSASQEEEKKDDPPKEEGKDDENTDQPEEGKLYPVKGATWADSTTKVYFANKGLTSTNYYLDAIVAEIKDNQAVNAGTLKLAYLGNQREGSFEDAKTKDGVTFYQSNDGKFYEYTETGWNEVPADRVKSYLALVDKVFEVPETVVSFSDYTMTIQGQSILYEVVITPNGSHTYGYDSDGDLITMSSEAEINGKKKVYTLWPKTLTKCDPEYFPQL